MASTNTKMRLRNRSKSSDADEFEGQSKKFRKGVNKLKLNHGNQPMNDKLMAEVKVSQVAEGAKMTFKTAKKRETWKVVNKMKQNHGNQGQNHMNDEVMAKVKSSQVAEREKMTFKTAKKRETWKVVNKLKPNHGNQHRNRMNDEVLDKGKSSQVDERDKMTVNTTMKKRETRNSSFGTDIGVIEQICDNIENRQENPNNSILSKNHVSPRENISTETSLGDQIQIVNEKGSVEIADNSTNIEKDNKVTEVQKKEEEIKIMKQKLVKTPANMDIKQENSSDDDEEIQIMFKNLVPTPTFKIKQEQPSYQPKVSFTLVNGNLDTVSQATNQRVLQKGQIRIRKDIFASTSVEKLPAGTSESTAKPTQQPGPSDSLASSKQSLGSKSHVNCQHPEGPPRHNTSPSMPFARKGLIITPLGLSAGNSSSTGLIMTPIVSSASKSSSNGLIITPVGSAESNSASRSFSTASSAETTERVSRSQGNSSVNNVSEEVTETLNGGAIPSIVQKIKSQENLTIKIDSGEVTVTDGGRTVQMKTTGGSISGQADDVNNVVKTLAQVVRDL